LFGAVRERLRARAGRGGDESRGDRPKVEPTTAERLDDALARLREQAPPPEDDRPDAHLS